MAANRNGTDEHDREPAKPNVSPGAGAGATHGGAAGSGLGLSEESRARANTDDLSRGTQDAATDPASAAPEARPVAAPQASRTSPASGLRGTGGGLGDAVGGARRATAAEMTGDPGRDDTQSGGRLQDLDAAFDRRDEEHPEK